ncbi:MAG: hypothetical protein ACP5LT_03100 [Candidatus Kapaibacteriota bacterium]
MKNFLIVSVIIVLLLSCAKEDPNLVNPPPPYQSIRIRLLNTIVGTEGIAWGYDGKPFSNSAAYLELTKALLPPPYDSIKIDFFQNGTLIYSTPRKIRLVRETRYLLIPGKSLRSDAKIDTFMVLSTTFGLPKKLGKSYFKFVNLVRDSNLKVSIIEGCPNGKPLVSNVPYFSYPFLQTIPYGNYIFSIVVNNGIQSNLVNIYSIDFQEDKEYTLFFAEKPNGTKGLFLLDDYDTTSTALIELQPISERSAFLRIANFSSESVSVTKIPSNILVENLGSFKLTQFLSLPACQSDFLDTLEVVSNSGTTLLNYSFDVFKKYTLLVFDSAESRKKLSIVPPVQLNKPSTGFAVVRVFNALDTDFAITLSMGARNKDNAVGFTSGEALAVNLKSRRLSEPVLIEPGYLPLTLFSSTEPTFLIKSIYTNVNANESYLIVVFKSPDGNIQLSAVNDNLADAEIHLLDKGCFFQFLNASNENQVLNLSLGNYLTSVKLSFKESFATVLPQNFNQIEINGKFYQIALDSNKNGTYIVSRSLDLFDISIPPMGTERNSLRRRFFNASSDIESASVYYDTLKQNVVVNDLKYGSASDVVKVFQERKFSLVFFDNKTGNMISQFNDIFLSLGKNYTIVFAGSRNKGYSLIVMQEY